MFLCSKHILVVTNKDPDRVRGSAGGGEGGDGVMFQSAADTEL